MLRLRSTILAPLLSSPATHLGSSLHRLLSAAAAAISPNPSFAAEQYLVDTCGLTRAQALKASPKLTHLKSPSNPDAVLAFLAGIGLSTADVAALVAKDPKLLCAGVERTLTPILVGLTGLGLSHSEISRLVSLVPATIRCRSIVSSLPYYLSLFGSYDNFLRALKRCPDNFLSADLERVVKPNVGVLRECGLGACDIAKLCIQMPRLLNAKQGRLQAIVACAQGLGVPCWSRMFVLTLQAVGFRSEETIAAKVDDLKKMFRLSDAELGIALSKNPNVLTKSKETMQHKSEFLINEMGLEPAYIARRPSMLSYSLEGRLRPSSYGLTRKLRRTWQKTMQQPAEGKCLLDSDLHEPAIVIKIGTILVLLMICVLIIAKGALLICCNYLQGQGRLYLRRSMSETQGWESLLHSVGSPLGLSSALDLFAFAAAYSSWGAAFPGSLAIFPPLLLQRDVSCRL